ncbi:hypothetical protein [Burkholderia pseudomultivorans]|uniref:hypothetical protein n=1 Tax=Burkholderia pseudomultivorans TaxID=1207504 RepID=UPI00188FD6E0|nr:hypothetical protein [Burkholderia pseudomultivorans]MBF5014821.1 hypothetical protein [Burkholderia pseudomultivorans]MDS0857559.1 hypothetical protein [Burkholderia pseudomultivorans]
MQPTARYAPMNGRRHAAPVAGASPESGVSSCAPRSAGVHAALSSDEWRLRVRPGMEIDVAAETGGVSAVRFAAS